MNHAVYTYTLLVGAVIAFLAMVTGARSYHLPDNQQDYQPTQPIAFSHHMHAGQLSIDCQYCHTAAETSRHVGIPSANICMNCHKIVTSSWGAVLEADKEIKKEKKEAEEKGDPLSPEELEDLIKEKTPVSDELKKLYEALALDDYRLPDPNKSTTPIEWVKVHNLPDYVCFDHRGHVHAGVDCQTCHGNVESMERVRQVESLSMGWCINCHRESNRIGVKGKPVNASIDCTTCHY